MNGVGRGVVREETKELEGGEDEVQNDSDQEELRRAPPPCGEGIAALGSLHGDVRL